MEKSSTAIVVILFVMACIGTSSAQALAPGPSSSSSTEDDCLTKLLNMSDCLSYVTEGSNVTAPDKACCPELAGLVESSPVCLCQFLGKSDTFGINVDVNRALKLPSVCHVSTPPVNLCSVVGGAPSASQGPMYPGFQSPTGLAASPSTGNNDSAASGNVGSALVILIIGLAFTFLI